jgi:hypothetical protein
MPVHWQVLTVEPHIAETGQAILSYPEEWAWRLPSSIFKYLLFASLSIIVASTKAATLEWKDKNILPKILPKVLAVICEK